MRNMKPKREAVVATRLTAGEKARLDFLCEQLGLSSSSLIRHWIAREVQANDWMDHEAIVASIQMDREVCNGD